MRFLAAFALVLTLALAALGCGLTRKAPKSKFAGVQADVAAAVATLASAAKNGDEGKICTQVMSRSLVRRSGGPVQCKKRISDSLDDSDPTQLGMSVNAVALGPGKPPTTATATVKSGTGKDAVTGKMALVKQGGTWRVDSFG
jgi:hypothetical protein